MTFIITVLLNKLFENKGCFIGWCSRPVDKELVSESYHQNKETGKWDVLERKYKHVCKRHASFLIKIDHWNNRRIRNGKE